jgi:hypothetical protein
VAGDDQIGRVEICDADGNTAQGLCSIDEQQRAMFAAKRGDLGNRLNDSGFVVRELDDDESRPFRRAYDCFKRFEIHQTVRNVARNEPLLAAFKSASCSHVRNTAKDAQRVGA